MRLRISHTTTYDYDSPVPYALQQLRMTPKSHDTQKILNWDIRVTGGTKQLQYEDAHRNVVDLIGLETDTRQVVVQCTGEVEVTENAGVMGSHGGFMPLWMFQRDTPLTKPGPLTRKMVAPLKGIDDPLDRLHALSTAIREGVAYETGMSQITWTVEDVLAAGHGVCQDHTHVFLSGARLLGIPARYVSGYLMMDDRIEQDATHAWAEGFVDGLGWVGFDISNGIAPDTRYVRVATGLDYGDAAPVSGTRYGSAGEKLAVHVQVQQQ